MDISSFDEFFSQATGNPEPYPYQRRFATGRTLPSLLSVPTGVGKTATAVLGWLWRRRFADSKIRTATPRRLVFCLPMRTLVEQTRDECVKWLKNLELSGDEVGVHILMGGEDGDRWDEFPERDAIIIGTQDMLLSRALNRGYGMSRYRWPMHFGLLNNDCLWVLDETQLMGVGVTTSCQLAGFRRAIEEDPQVFGSCQTIWMSATLDNDTLQTVNHPKPDPDADGLTLDADDRRNERVSRLLNAKKPLHFASATLSPDSAKKAYESAFAAEVTEQHKSGTLTLVVVNNVERAQKLFAQLQKLEPTDDIALIHSRFRPHDRRETQWLALDETTIDPKGAGRIIVATQAIEAGVDISSTTLFTELATWSSLVQRFGRCNRRGTCGLDDNETARVFVVDFETSDAKKARSLCLPYEVDSLEVAREQLRSLDDVGPEFLADIVIEQPHPVVHVLRRKDLVDLFDTTPDLSGNDLDVSRYIRDGDDTDVQVYWSDWEFNASSRSPRLGDDGTVLNRPRRDELCSVPIGKMKSFVDRLKKQSMAAWAWDPLSNEWRSIGKSEVRPGMTLLLHSSSGGYTKELGWTGETKHKPVDPIPVAADDVTVEPLETMSADDLAGAGQPLELTQHLLDVLEHADRLQTAFQGASFGPDVPWDAILTAARWHDVGKSHLAFQTAMRDSEAIAAQDPAAERLWAKSGERGYPKYRVPVAAAPPRTLARPTLPREGEVDDLTLPGESRPEGAERGSAHTSPTDQRRFGFRHELASALVWLAHNDHTSEPTVNLIAYLIAAHHGKVRLSIRSMPNESPPKDPQRKFARGIHEGDALPSVDLGNNTESTPIDFINLDLMSLGASDTQNESWLARSIALRDELGPFRLAYLETLVRTADWRGSADPGCGKST